MRLINLYPDGRKLKKQCSSLAALPRSLRRRASRRLQPAFIPAGDSNLLATHQSMS